MAKPAAAPGGRASGSLGCHPLPQLLLPSAHPDSRFADWRTTGGVRKAAGLGASVAGDLEHNVRAHQLGMDRFGTTPPCNHAAGTRPLRPLHCLPHAPPGAGFQGVEDGRRPPTLPNSPTSHLPLPPPQPPRLRSRSQCGASSAEPRQGLVGEGESFEGPPRAGRRRRKGAGGSGGDPGRRARECGCAECVCAWVGVKGRAAPGMGSGEGGVSKPVRWERAGVCRGRVCFSTAAVCVLVWGCR